MILCTRPECQTTAGCKCQSATADDPSLWRFWNAKARELAASNDALRAALAEKEAALRDAEKRPSRHVDDMNDLVLMGLARDEAEARAAAAEAREAELRKALEIIEARVYGSAINLGGDIVDIARRALTAKEAFDEA